MIQTIKGSSWTSTKGDHEVFAFLWMDEIYHIDCRVRCRQIIIL